MASKLLSLNSLMDRKKPKDKTDELAIVKAAAWAWYQHGSGSEGKATNEFNVTRTHRAPRPSRYKLEAMRMAQEEGSPVHTKISLFDKYEVQSISRRLDTLIESSHNKLSNGFINGDSVYSAKAASENGDGRLKKKNKKTGKGFWLRHAAICGTREDVVGGRALRDGQPSAKRVSAVNLSKCLPRANCSAL